MQLRAAPRAPSKLEKIIERATAASALAPRLELLLGGCESLGGASLAKDASGAAAAVADDDVNGSRSSPPRQGGRNEDGDKG